MELLPQQPQPQVPNSDPDNHYSQLVQLELINNISNLFQDLESKHSETRKLLDFLCGFIVKKFGNEADFPQQILKIVGQTVDEKSKSSIQHSCTICHQNFPNNQDLQYHSMSHCSVRLERIENIPALQAQALNPNPNKIPEDEASLEFQFPIPIVDKESIEKVEAPEDVDDLPLPLDASNFLEIQHEMDEENESFGGAQEDPLFVEHDHEESEIHPSPVPVGIENSPGPSAPDSPLLRNILQSGSAQEHFNCPAPNCKCYYFSKRGLHQHFKHKHKNVNNKNRRTWFCPYICNSSRNPNSGSTYQCNYKTRRKGDMRKHWKATHKQTQLPIPDFPFIDGLSESQSNV